MALAPGAFTLRLPRGRVLELGGLPRVMGVINLTPDSFSDGGRFPTADAAVEHGLRMAAEGATILDLGAESTRPGGGVYGDGAATVPVDEELARLLPVLTGLRRKTDAVLSVDTRKGAVAREALRAGADLVNDVGGLQDPALVEAVAAAGVPVVVMHSRGELGTMQAPGSIRFEDVVDEVSRELGEAIDRGVAGGIAREQIVVDPGLGFGKTTAQNVALLAAVDRLAELGRPVLIGASRKSFLAQVAGPAPPEERLGGSLAAVAWAAALGAAIVRVHDVRETIQLLHVWNAIHSERARPLREPTRPAPS